MTAKKTPDEFGEEHFEYTMARAWFAGPRGTAAPPRLTASMGGLVNSG
jgi:hypothetical protein